MCNDMEEDITLPNEEEPHQNESNDNIIVIDEEIGSHNKEETTDTINIDGDFDPENKVDIAKDQYN